MRTKQVNEIWSKWKLKDPAYRKYIGFVTETKMYHVFIIDEVVRGQMIPIPSFKQLVEEREKNGCVVMYKETPNFDDIKEALKPYLVKI